MLPFVTQCQPLVSTIKEALMAKWNLIQNQPLLKNHLLIPTGKENHGKEPACWSQNIKVQHTVSRRSPLAVFHQK